MEFFNGLVGAITSNAPRVCTWGSESPPPNLSRPSSGNGCAQISGRGSVSRLSRKFGHTPGNCRILRAGLSTTFAVKSPIRLGSSAEEKCK